MTKRWFAVGIGKGWVEVRSAAQPPRKKVTEASYVDNVRKPVYGDITYQATPDHAITYRGITKYEVRDRKVTLSHTDWIGGRVNGIIRSQVFSRLLNVNVQRGGMVELLPEQVEKLKERFNG